jgi:hypothetical protein
VAGAARAEERLVALADALDARARTHGELGLTVPLVLILAEAV